MTEQRDFEVRMSETEDRVMTGLVVPWNQTIELGGYREKFVRGAIDPADLGDAILMWSHTEPIGRIVRGIDTDRGFAIEARISDTPRGNEIRTLMQDGVLTRMSIGFTPVEDGKDADGTIVRKKVKMHEGSVVIRPAYSEAKILAVREETEPEQTNESETEMTETTPEVAQDDTAISEVRDQVANLERRIATFQPTTIQERDLSYKFRNMGEWVQAVAKGDDDAVELHRAFAGGVAGATVANPDPIVKNAWVLESIRLLDFGRPSLNAFRSIPLPSEGMSVEFPVVSTNAMQVAQQANESDALTFGKITLTSQTAAVNTHGGYTAMSRQAIERSSYGYVDTAMRALVIAYTKSTNAAFITALKGGAGYGTASAAATNAGWITAITDAAMSIYQNSGLQAQFILCAPNVYKKIVTLVDGSDRGTVAAGNPSNNTGTASIPGLSATILGLPVIVDPALASGDCYIANAEGVTSFESPGAPFRLTDEDNVVLTKDFSVYGYAAFAVTNPGAVVDVTVA